MLFQRLLVTLMPMLLENTASRGRLLFKLIARDGVARALVYFEGVETEQRLLDTVFDRLAQTEYGLQLGRGYSMLFCRTTARYLGGDLKLSQWKGHGIKVELFIPYTSINQEPREARGGRPSNEG
jgi:sensor histidine kinase regulating citrate/malate metabolism